MTVLAVDPSQRTNAERVVDLAALGYLPEPVLDPTYGTGGMWKKYQPKELFRSDLYPRSDDVPRHDFRSLPWPDGMFGSVLFDPPYRLAGTATNQGGMDSRYGIDRYRSVEETHELILAGLAESARVTRVGGYVIVKCQAQVAGGKVRWQPYLVSCAAAELRPWRLYLVDELHLLSGRAQPPRKCKACKGEGVVRIAPPISGVSFGISGGCTACAGLGRVEVAQQHARRNYSTFLVFQRRS